MVLAADPPAPASYSTGSADTTDARNQSPGDTRTAQHIDTRLKDDQYHLFRQVTVSVHDGVAHLSGFV
jgi:osmotically-inducible protein OsmY